MRNTLTKNAGICAEAIENASSIALLSGAGMSTSAGIPDFRGPHGIYRQKMHTDPMKIFDINYFYRDPSFFYRFHRQFLETIDTIEPTFTHKFFATLEERGRLQGIVTQNIDALHQRGGSKKVLEIHGSAWSSHCLKCGRKYDYENSFRKTLDEEVPKCDICGGVIKPDIVFFGENVKHLEECQKLVSKADLLFVVGSSLVVTPAALLPSMCDGRIVIVNKGEISSAYLPEGGVYLHVEEDIDDFFRAVNEKLHLL